MPEKNSINICPLRKNDRGDETFYFISRILCVQLYFLHRFAACVVNGLLI